MRRLAAATLIAAVAAPASLAHELVDLDAIQTSLICLLKTEADLKSVTPEVTSRLVGQAA